MTASDARFTGRVMLVDGTHVGLTPAEAEAIVRSIDRSKAKLAADMPTSVDAASEISRAMYRLNQLGWRSGTSCPRGGDVFALIQLGCTGIGTGVYYGAWPHGTVISGAFVIKPETMMWKALDALTPDERATLEKTEGLERAALDRELRSFEAAQEGV